MHGVNRIIGDDSISVMKQTWTRKHILESFFGWPYDSATVNHQFESGYLSEEIMYILSCLHSCYLVNKNQWNALEGRNWVGT